MVEDMDPKPASPTENKVISALSRYRMVLDKALKDNIITSFLFILKSCYKEFRLCHRRYNQCPQRTDKNKTKYKNTGTISITITAQNHNHSSKTLK